MHFPDGQHADLTNADILENSVSFTESLCSRDHLQFGLCESPSITFKTIGVPNIRTYKIECSLEIDVSSITPIPAGAKYIAALNSYGISIPYGVFYVDSCQRDWQGNTRTVTAYGKQAYSDWGKIDIEAFKENFPVGSNGAFNANMQLYMWSQFDDPVFAKSIAQKHGTKRQVEAGHVLDRSKTLQFTRNGVQGTLTATWYVPYMDVELTNDINSALYIEYKNNDGIDYDKEWTDYKIEMFTLNVLQGSVDAQTKQTVLDWLYDLRDNYFLYPNWWITNEYDGVSVTGHEKCKGIENKIFYPYIQGITNSYGSYSVTTHNSFEIPLGFKLDYVDSNMSYTNHWDYDREASVYDITAPLNLTVSAQRKKTSVKINNKAVSAYIVNDQENYELGQQQDIMTAMEEILGELGHFGRDGSLQSIRLDNTTNYPGSSKPTTGRKPTGTCYNIDRRMLTKLTLLDEKSLPYDRVSMIYTNTSGTEIYIYKDIVDTTAEDYDAQKYQSYTLGWNWIIQNKQLTATQAESILNEIAENIKNTEYSPLQLTMKGLPFLETGDRITITADGESFETYILAHTLKGVSNITDTITSY